MRLAICLAALALLLPTSAAAAPARTVDATPPTLDGIRLPITYAAAKKRFGAPSKVGRLIVGCFATRDVTWRQHGLRLTFTAGRLDPLSNRARAGSVAVTSWRWRTPAGLRPGDPVSRLRRLHPDAENLGRGYWLLESAPQADEPPPVLQAIVRNGAVREINVIADFC